MGHDILIVDDERDICTLIAGILEDEGHTARRAHNSTEAIDAVRQRRPALVILDVWLQGSELKYAVKTGAGAFTESSPTGVVVGGRSVSLAVDSSGTPGVAFFVAGTAAGAAELVFCGEHTAIGSRGMEGALESGERASLEVMNAIG